MASPINTDSGPNEIESISSQTGIKLRELLILVAIALTALALAWPTLHCGVWLDEILSIHSSTAPDIPTLIKSCFGRQDDYHPPLSFIILNIFMGIFGSSDVAVKIPSLICGIATVPALYWLGRTVHSPQVGLLTAFIFALSPFASFFSTQCRGYALALLLSTLTATVFIRLDRDRRLFSGHSVALCLLMAALCYTEYVTCSLIALLSLAAAIDYLFRFFENSNPTSRKNAAANFLKLITPLAAAALLFTPWLPSILMQYGGASYADKPGLNRFFEVFTYSFLNTMPVPVPLGFIVATCLIALFALKLLRNPKTCVNPALKLQLPLITIACISFIPPCFTGFVFGFWNNYYRYVYPYSFATWTLVALALYYSFWEKQQIGLRARIGLTTTLCCLLSINVAYILWFDKKPNSGFYTFTSEIKRGLHDDSAILVFPDVLGPTVAFYLPDMERAKHHIGVFGFPRWGECMEPAIIPQMASHWQPDNLVSEYSEKIAELPSKGYKRLLMAKDSDKQIEFLSTKQMPRKKRLDELLAMLKSKYRLASVDEYPGSAETITVLNFELDGQ
ncbi:MAG TPA: glycosyltransferase family 39 protein [Candidatus Melainabacteria bacterium]|nr:glycosyltransferase family 39 protein [Candidatus Melainabacteria bacterium]